MCVCVDFFFFYLVREEGQLNTLPDTQSSSDTGSFIYAFSFNIVSLMLIPMSTFWKNGSGRWVYFDG